MHNDTDRKRDALHLARVRALRAAATAQREALRGLYEAHAEVERLRAQLAPLAGTGWTPAGLYAAYRELLDAYEAADAEAAQLRARLAHARAEAQRLTAELDGAHCAALNLLAKERTNSGSGRDGHLNEDDLAPLLAALRIDAAHNLGSVPRAQGVGVDRPETAVDGQTPLTGSRGMGRDANGAQNATQAGVREDRSPRCAHCGCPRTHHDRADLDAHDAATECAP